MIRSISCRLLVPACVLASPAPGCAQEPLYDLLVSSRNTHSVKRYDAATGAYVDDFIRSGSAGLDATQEIRLGPDGDVLVSGRGNPQILRFDGRTGEPRGTFTSGYSLSEPTKMSWGPDGNLYVSQWGPDAETVAVFGPDGAFIREATPAHDDPMQHVWDEDGNLLVVYWAAPRVVRRFAPDGTPIDVFVEDPARLRGPVNLRWDGNGDLQVFDWQGGGVYVYDGRDGSYLSTFITGIRSPEGWAVGPDGLLYIAEWNGNAVKRFNAETGELVDTFISSGGLQAPNSLLFVERPSVFELQVSDSAIALPAGTSTDVEVQVAGVRGVSFDEPVGLSCSTGNPVVTCAVDPSSVTPGGAGASATVTVTAAMPGSARLAGAVGLGLLVMLVAGAVGAGRRELLVMGALAVGVSLVSCGGSGTGPDPEITTTLVVVGESGDLSSEVIVRVTVG